MVWPFDKLLGERDGAAIGRAAGALLADTLLGLAEGRRPGGPVGASRVGREVRRVSFADGAAAGAWLASPGLKDAFLVDVAADRDEVRVLVPSVEANAFDIVWSVRFAVDARDGTIATSEPGFVVADGMDELLDEVNDGIAAGLEMHPRTAELRDGFGALGEFVVGGDA